MVAAKGLSLSLTRRPGGLWGNLSEGDLYHADVLGWAVILLGSLRDECSAISCDTELSKVVCRGNTCGTVMKNAFLLFVPILENFAPFQWRSRREKAGKLYYSPHSGSQPLQSDVYPQPRQMNSSSKSVPLTWSQTEYQLHRRLYWNNIFELFRLVW